MDPFLTAIIIVVIIAIANVVVQKLLSQKKSQRRTQRQDQREDPKEQDEKLPYHFKYLLTKNEWDFYKKMKVVADKHDLHIIAKVRLADLVEVDDYLTGNAFN